MDDSQRIQHLEAAMVALLARVSGLEQARATASASTGASAPIPGAPIEKQVRCMDEGIRVSGLATRLFCARGDDFDLSVQFTVSNSHPDFEVIACELQAIDGDGFALEELGSDLFVPAGESETVRRLLPMRREIAERVRGLSLRCQGVES